jgi:hypothetical protein
MERNPIVQNTGHLSVALSSVLSFAIWRDEIGSKERGEISILGAKHPKIQLQNKGASFPLQIRLEHVRMVSHHHPLDHLTCS